MDNWNVYETSAQLKAIPTTVKALQQLLNSDKNIMAAARFESSARV